MNHRDAETERRAGTVSASRRPFNLASVFIAVSYKPNRAQLAGGGRKAGYGPPGRGRFFKRSHSVRLQPLPPPPPHPHCCYNLLRIFYRGNNLSQSAFTAVNDGTAAARPALAGPQLLAGNAVVTCRYQPVAGGISFASSFFNVMNSFLINFLVF